MGSLCRFIPRVRKKPVFNACTFSGKERLTMLFQYQELKEAVREDFERFYQMGFDENQILPAVLNEYQYGEDFCRAENICIHLFLAGSYQEKGFAIHKLTERIHNLITEESCGEIQAAFGDEYGNYAADLAAVQELEK